jgi:predicted nucleic acid-binding protein
MKVGIDMYFLDTYAMIEYLKGNSKFVEIIDNGNIATSDFQLMEIYYYGLKDFDESTAEKYYEAFSSILVQVPEKTLKNAMKKKLELQKRKINLSYVDAIGYQYAIDNQLKFVTGDQSFKDLDTVNVIYLGK